MKKIFFTIVFLFLYIITFSQCYIDSAVISNIKYYYSATMQGITFSKYVSNGDSIYEVYIETSSQYNIKQYNNIIFGLDGGVNIVKKKCHSICERDIYGNYRYYSVVKLDSVGRDLLSKSKIKFIKVNGYIYEITIGEYIKENLNYFIKI